MAIKGARVSDYGGKSLNISGDYIIDPPGEPRCSELKAWYNDKTSGGKEL